MEIPRTDRVAFIVALALALGGCASLNQHACGQGEQFLVHDTLSFGTAKPNGIVAPEEWQEFLRSTVTPRFPRGFATLESSGQWRAADGSILREASHVLVLDHPNAASEHVVREIIRHTSRGFSRKLYFG